MKLIGRILLRMALIGGLLALALAGFAVYLLIHMDAAASQGQKQLSAELRMLRNEGAPTTPTEMQQPLPPAAVNAALDYKKLTALLLKKPLTSREKSEVVDLGKSGRSTPAQDAAVSRLLNRRSDVMALVYQAARKPQCVFVRDWSKTMQLDLSDYATMRQAAKLIRARSYLLAKSGRFRDAIATDALAFRVADQVGHEPIFIRYLVNIACDKIALDGMNQILQLSGDNAAIADAVRTTIANHRPSINIRRALGGEVVMDMGAADTMRVQSAPVKARSGEAAPLDGFGAWRAGRMNGLTDAMLAMTLHYNRLLLETTSLPQSKQRAAYDRIILETTHLQARDDKYLTLSTLATNLLPIITQAADKKFWIHAQERVVMAGAAVLAYRARHGSYPDRLDQAASNLPPDPFTQKPLLYRREPYGFIVFSAGPTGHFDGRPGRPHEDKEAFFQYPRV